MHGTVVCLQRGANERVAAMPYATPVLQGLCVAGSAGGWGDRPLEKKCQGEGLDLLGRSVEPRAACGVQKKMIGKIRGYFGCRVVVVRPFGMVFKFFVVVKARTMAESCLIFFHFSTISIACTLESFKYRWEIKGYWRYGYG